ncbi:MAG: hypothetical protein AVO35_05545 [Candidatus Aegiribacteria sp. MLS_C]|nr:MAG: hypothetical protein AVO35_05545 [Candidatus Aegiribacteria sp. MLS_C]
MFLVWEVTAGCNLECVFCYNPWRAEGRSIPPDLSTAGMVHLAGRIAEAGPVSVTLTGGEPLLRGDLEVIAAELAGRGIPAGVATNGMLLDDRRAESLVRAGVRWFEIPVHGCSPGTVEALTGRDCIKGTRAAMLAAGRAGATLTASHAITSINYRETADAVKTAFALGAVSMALNRFVPGGAGLDRLDLLPSGEQLGSALVDASKAAMQCRGMLVYTGIPVEPCLHDLSRCPGLVFGPCVCGSEKWAVGPEGELRVCEQSPNVLGSMVTGDFIEMTSSRAVEEFRSREAFPECGRCPSFPRCGSGCRFLRAYL